MNFVMKTSDTVEWVYTSNMTKKEVIDAELSTNSIITGLARVSGILLLSIGLYLLFSPVITLLSFIKFLADVVGIVLFVVCLLVGIVIGFIIIALAWLFYRPFLSLGLMALAGGIIGFFVILNSQESGAAKLL